MDSLLHDLRYALRALARSPGFTLVTVLTLALGIGANTTMFSVINAVLLRPLAGVMAPERLVGLYTSDYSGPPYGTSSFPDVVEFAAQRDLFAGVMAYTQDMAAVGRGEDVERRPAELVTGTYFEVLRLTPALGRFFAADEARPQSWAPVAVVSHAFWLAQLRGDSLAIGREIVVAGRPLTLIGVAPAGFTGMLRGLAVDVWLPLRTGAELGLGVRQPADLAERGARVLWVMARLAPGVTREQAEERLRVVARRLHAAYPDAWTDINAQVRRVTLLPESATRVPPQMRRPALGFAALLMATVGVVLLIACANVANLTLARAVRRGREIGVRLSLGASRGRIMRQMLTESAVLAALGAAGGLLLALWSVDLFTGVRTPLPFTVHLDVAPDLRVLAFTLVIAVGTAVLTGLAPALRASRRDVAAVLKGAVPVDEVGRPRVTLRGVLVVVQMALSFLLLTGALLMLRTLRDATHIDPGFRADRMLLVDVEPPPAGPGKIDPTQFALGVRDQVAAVPGVRAVTWAEVVPLGSRWQRRSTTVAGYQPARGEDMEFDFNVVGPGYFRTMEIPLLRGRDFTDADRPGAPGVLIVNESFARRFWPGEDPLGKRVSIRGDEGPFLEVVGVARDGKYRSLAESGLPYVYAPALQEPRGMTLHVRTTGEPASYIPAVRRAVSAAAPGFVVARPRTMAEHLGQALLPQRAAGTVLGSFALVALLLASLGLYGVVSYAVAQRTREIGVRVALGADRRRVLGFVLRQGARLAAVGLAVGVPLAWATTRLLTGLLLGGSAADPTTFAGAAVLLCTVALLATYVPARRAAHIEPMVALRYE
jgi:predicted permease